MKIKEGDEVTSVLDGQGYTITKIVGNRVILSSKNGEKQILTEIKNLQTLYRKKEEVNQ